MEILKDKFIRETEEAIDRRVTRLNAMKQELAEVETEIMEHRKLLHLLKSGNNKFPSKFKAPNGSTPTIIRGRHTQDVEIVRAIKENLKEPFTAKQLADLIGYSRVTTAAHKLRKMEENGFVKLAEQGEFMAGVGSDPNLWRTV